MPIYWDLFTWEAFGTLATGAAAVAGAVLVGYRQVRIADRQTTILGRQTELESIKIRIELFERRWAIYEAAQQYLALAAALSPIPPAVDIEFGAACRRAPFLLGDEVGEVLEAILSDNADRLESTKPTPLETVAEGLARTARGAAAAGRLARSVRDLELVFRPYLRVGVGLSASYPLQHGFGPSPSELNAFRNIAPLDPD